MKSMWQETARRSIQERLTRLTVDHQPKWGRLTAPKMVAHLTQSFKSAIGELAVAPRNLPVRHSPLKELIIYWLPFPKNVPTAPEMLAREPGDWQADVRELADLFERFASRNQADAWPDHAAFGHLTGAQWGVLMYRHTDHHFRQFGV
jgi:hypothetical protein